MILTAQVRDLALNGVAESVWPGKIIFEQLFNSPLHSPIGAHMSVSSIGRSLVLVFLTFTFVISPVVGVIAAAQVQVGDVVNVHYYRWEDPEHTSLAENSDLQIYIGSSVPSELSSAFPKLTQVITGLWQGAVGMSVGEEKEFSVPPELAYNDGRTLYFKIRILEIVYSFTVPSLGGFALPVALLLVGVSSAIGLGVIGFLLIRSRRNVPSQDTHQGFLDKRAQRIQALDTVLSDSMELQTEDTPRKRIKRR
jgi:hypothetical protein